MQNKKYAKNPYYIVAPAFTSKSAGIRLIYILCDLLNRKGCRAFIIVAGYQDGAKPEYPYSYQVPLLSYQESIQHIHSGMNPIVIRAEVGRETMHFPATFRYILNYIGHFPGEPKEADPEFQIDKKFFWAFSKDIAKRHNIPENRVIFTPILDTEVFFPQKTENRRGNVCYLGKYAELHSTKLPKEVDESFYVFHRGGNNVPEREEYAEKFRNAELCYIYENTSVITEALMCGCPVVCVPNDYCKFDEQDMIGLAEIGLNGIAIGTNPEEIARAKATVHLVRERILQLMAEFETKIDFFIEETQKISQEVRLDKVKVLKSLQRHFAKKKPNKIIRELKRALYSVNFLEIPAILLGSKKNEGFIVRIKFTKTPKVIKSLMRRIK